MSSYLKQCSLSGGSVLPSRQDHRRYACTLLTQGSLEGHGLSVSGEVLQASLPEFQQATAFLDHASFGETRTLDKLLGVFSDVRFSQRTASLDATLELWDTPSARWLAPVLDQLVLAQEDGDPAADIGLSADCWIVVGDEATETGELPITRIVNVESVDVVFKPASDGARFKRILASVPAPVVPPAVTAPAVPEPQLPSVECDRSECGTSEYGGAIPDAHERKNSMTQQLTDHPAPSDAGALNPGAQARPRRATMLERSSSPASAPTADPASEALFTATRQLLIDTKLQASGLPDPNQQNIRRRVSNLDLSIEELDREIDAERTMLAALAQSDVIQGFGTPIDESMMTAPMDVARNAVRWMMGVPGAELPPPDLRMPSSIYFALTGDFDWHGIHRPDRAKFARASTSTLADLATDAMNVIMTEQWEALRGYRWFEPLVTVAPHDGSLNDMNWVAFGGIANLPSVAEGQTYTELNVADSKETDSFTKYGGYVGITEEMFRKNQMLKIQGIPRALAASAIRTRSYYISYIFSQSSGLGPTLDDDSIALFNASHSNYATTAFSVSAWASARQELYEQTQLGSSKPLAIWPKFLLVPVELYDTALVTFGYGQGPGGYPATADNDVNPYAMARPGDPRPEVVVVPEWTDANNWYYLADPAIQPVIFMSYAQQPGGGGHPMPELFTVSSPTAGLIFTNDVLPIKVRDWFAYGVAGYRGVGGRVVS